MRRKLKTTRKLVLGLLVFCAATLWWLSRPEQMEGSDLDRIMPNASNGERVFYAGGCGSCHGEDTGRTRNDLRLAGGLELETPVGIFRVPNISPDPVSGIGGWTTPQFVNAVRNGVSPDGNHYYPSFPYSSYQRMTTQDIVDLKAFIDTLTPMNNQVPNHDIKLMYRMRWSLGLWKLLFLDEGPVVEFSSASDTVRRGRYLVEGPGHCGECHTPRNILSTMDTGQWLAGAANPVGEGRVPNITPGSDGLADWTEEDIAYFLQTGVDPGFDMVGGDMVKVQENISRLSEQDRKDIAAYLKRIPAQPRSD